MKKVKGVIYGLIVVAIGVVLGLNALKITDIDLFFDGWWTLLIIVPSALSLLTSHNKWSGIVGVLVGVVLLLNCRDILDFALLWKIVLPVLIIAIGLKIIFSNLFKKKPFPKLSATVKNNVALFSGQEYKYVGEIFKGSVYTAVFGGIECDLRGAMIENNAVIDANAVFGGIDILLPENVNVKIKSTALFGGVDSEDHKNSDENVITVYVNAKALFGGVDVK